MTTLQKIADIEAEVSLSSKYLYPLFTLKYSCYLKFLFHAITTLWSILVVWLECRFLIQSFTVRTPASVCYVLEQDTIRIVSVESAVK